MHSCASSHSTIASKNARSRSPASPGRPCHEGPPAPRTPSGYTMNASGQTRDETRASMYWAFMPNGWNTSSTGAGVRPSDEEGTLRMKKRVREPTWRVIGPEPAGSPPHAARASATGTVNRSNVHTTASALAMCAAPAPTPYLLPTSYFLLLLALCDREAVHRHVEHVIDADADDAVGLDGALRGGVHHHPVDNVGHRVARYPDFERVRGHAAGVRQLDGGVF